MILCSLVCPVQVECHTTNSAGWVVASSTWPSGVEEQREQPYIKWLINTTTPKLLFSTFAVMISSVSNR